MVLESDRDGMDGYHATRARYRPGLLQVQLAPSFYPCCYGVSVAKFYGKISYSSRPDNQLFRFVT